jgi:glutamate/tyrosine decarboxylase-like PLP-dependent enzyme
MKAPHSAPATPFGVDHETLQQQGLRTLELITRHFRDLGSKPVMPACQAGELAARFPQRPPESPAGFNQILDELEEKIFPGITHWQHPKFFAYYPATSSIPAILSEMVISAIGSVGLQWSANPISTELECVVMDWIMEMLHAPSDSPFLHKSAKGGGIIQNTAGEALVVVMTAARVHKHLSLMSLDGKPPSRDQKEAVYHRDSSSLVVYMSDQTHFSGPKAARVAGMQVNTLAAKILDDGNYGITAAQVRQAMDRDRANGLVPCCLQLNYGTTNTCGYDDLDSFAGFAEEQGVWVHVDAAYAGPSLSLQQFKSRSLLIQKLATSFNFNGSKWFLCGFDSAFLFVRDRRLFKDVFSATDDYMVSAAEEATYNPEFKDWAVPLGRRFRSLRIWMVLQYFGVSGIHEFLQEGIRQGDWLRETIDRSDEFELIAKTDLGLVCFALKDASQMERYLKCLEQSGQMGQRFLVYPSMVEGRQFIRVALGGANTSLDHVKELWSDLKEAQQQVLQKDPPPISR